MLFGHFCLVVAGKTVVFRSSRGMALAAVSVCTAVVHWEGVVEGCPAPGGGIVALRTLSTEVVGRFISRMTGFAIYGTNRTVIKIGV